MKLLKANFLLLFLSVLSLNAQELPLINQFYPEDYKGDSQNWAVSQSDDNFIYVANNSGLLEFNGAEWKLYPTPNETIMRSVKVFEEKIFTGFYMDFGFWKKNEFGLLEYTSLVEKNKIKVLEDENFWNIIALDGWMLFQSLQRIYILNLKTGTTKIINSTSSSVITKIHEVGGSVYFQETGKGIFKIEKGIAKLVSEKEVFKHNNVVLILKKENELVFLTDHKGFFTLNKNFSFKTNELSNYLSDKTIYSAKELTNGDFVIGTISKGVVYASVNGEIKFDLNQRKGLLNNTVLTTFEDHDNNIWLGLDNGINKIDISSSIKKYKDIEGSLGTVYTSALYKGNLYLGTNQGLFYKKYKTKEAFRFIKNTQGQVWTLTLIDGELFCGHNTGTYIVQGGEVDKVGHIQGTWGLKKISTNVLLQGNYDGLYVLSNELGEWSVKNKIEGFNGSARYFECSDDNTILINHEYKGVFKLKVDKDFRNVLKIEIDATVTKGRYSSLLKFQNKIIYASKEGVYKYHEKSKGFIKDTLLDKLIDKKDFLSGRLVFNKATNKLFSFSKQHINYLRPDKFSAKSVLVKKGIANKLRKGAVGYENIQNLENDKYLIGTLNGYIIVDLGVGKEKDYKIGINTIENSHLNNATRKLELGKIKVLPFKYNNLEFFYSVPYLSKDVDVKYQYKLEGYTSEWSPWTSNSSVLFKNLSHGDYKFLVRGAVGTKRTSNIEMYKFSISRPWYSSNIAILLYVLSISIFSLFMDRLYKRYYQKQRQVLLEKQQKEFQLKTLESENELVEIRNKQLKLDVEGKSRELAISTMSMIKKNELLNGIKKEILNKNDDKSIKNVIRIIDKNLNNTDDWEMFEQAFNNADKEFISKVKKLHDNLTPNDLRLCAYLRLNLSSKEIAPLLNISTKSVEVKRYRLRKKMNLPHDVNLTSYFLDI